MDAENGVSGEAGVLFYSYPAFVLVIALLLLVRQTNNASFTVSEVIKRYWVNLSCMWDDRGE